LSFIKQILKATNIGILFTTKMHLGSAGEARFRHVHGAFFTLFMAAVLPLPLKKKSATKRIG
jgi:hypothetical protein